MTSDQHPTVRIAVVDDDTVIRDGLPLLLDDVEIAGTYRDVEELLAAMPDADVVLLDLHLAGTGRTGIVQGAAGITAVRAAGYLVLIYTNERRLPVLAEALATGAQGVIHKAELVTALREAIEAVAQGHVVITTALTGLAELVDRRGDLPTLSPRQRQVLRARARGEQFQSIANRLFISDRTAIDHMNKVNEKFADFLQAHSPADLERYLGIGPGDIHDQDL